MLNDRLQKAGKEVLGMDRFRPNIIISSIIAPREDDNSLAFVEDSFGYIRVGEVDLFSTGKKGRCRLTTVIQDKGERITRDEDPLNCDEPLETLASFRMFKGECGASPAFGHNFAAAASSLGKKIKREDLVTLIRRFK